MAGFAINPAQASRINPLDNPYFGTATTGEAPLGLGSADGSGLLAYDSLPDYLSFAPTYGQTMDGDSGMNPNRINPQAFSQYLQSRGYSAFEQANDSNGGIRYVLDSAGNLVGQPMEYSNNDTAFWNAALLAAAVTGANVYGAGGGFGAGAEAGAGTGTGTWGTPWTQSPDFGVIAAGAPEAGAGTVGGTVAGNGINFGANGAATLYGPTGAAAGTGSVIGTAAPAAGGWTVGNTLTAAQLASGVLGTYQQGQAAQAASQAQQQAAQQGITAQQQALQQITQQLAPYTNAGPGALKAQQDLAGLNGPQAQQAAIAALQASPQFTSQQQMGEERILANASATGGLRGGNVQAALAQFSPALLSQTINDQYARLGGLVNVGQNSAAGVGTATMGTANNVSNLFQQQGAAVAGGELARGRQTAGYIGAITNAIGLYYGITGGF